MKPGPKAGPSSYTQHQDEMLIYAIIAPEDSSLDTHDVRSAFGDSPAEMIPLSTNAWLVKTRIPTCAEVRDQVRNVKPGTCVAAKATEYNGYAKRDVWEKLEAWERE